MAKKKQFAGKKTKLAKLPLTQALTSQAEAEAASLRSVPPALSLFSQSPLTWDEVGAGRGGPLAGAFLFLVRELADLKSALRAAPGPAANHLGYLPPRVPAPAVLMEALSQARQGLWDLKSLLSRP